MTPIPASKIRKSTPTMHISVRDLTPEMVCVKIGRTLPHDVIRAMREVAPSAEIEIYAAP